MNTIQLPGANVALADENRSTRYAKHWLNAVGVTLVPLGQADVEVVAGGTAFPASESRRITLWDYQVGIFGTGYQASAVSGVSRVIGLPGRPPLALQADIPEKWCGLLGATLALATLLPAVCDKAPIEISAADILRACADQNAGNHSEISGGWNRNGRLAVEHGGIFPQGFYECADGYVAVVARSRADWLAILQAVGDPGWSQAEAMRDPFELAADDSMVAPLFAATMKTFSRDWLLDQAVKCGATLAPVYSIEEAQTRGLARTTASSTAGRPHVPFTFVPWTAVQHSSTA